MVDKSWCLLHTNPVMKVLKKGRPQKGWSKEYVCTGTGNKGGGCGATLLVEQADLFKTFSHCRDETTTYYTFKCPECGVLTDIANSDNASIYQIPFTPLEQKEWEEKNANRN